MHDIMGFGHKARTTHSTKANDVSSRSHAICQIEVDFGGEEMGKLILCDLAGSERAQDCQSNSRQRRLEGAEINKSLLALKECIRAMQCKSGHVPFRASKLTMALRDSFITEKVTSKIVMIACVCPGSSSADHTVNTLRYADRLKEKQNRAIDPSKAVYLKGDRVVSHSKEVKRALSREPHSARNLSYLQDKLERSERSRKQLDSKKLNFHNHNISQTESKPSHKDKGKIGYISKYNQNSPQCRVSKKMAQKKFSKVSVKHTPSRRPKESKKNKDNSYQLSQKRKDVKFSSPNRYQSYSKQESKRRSKKNAWEARKYLNSEKTKENKENRLKSKKQHILSSIIPKKPRYLGTFGSQRTHASVTKARGIKHHFEDLDIPATSESLVRRKQSQKRKIKADNHLLRKSIKLEKMEKKYGNYGNQNQTRILEYQDKLDDLTELHDDLIEFHMKTLRVFFCLNFLLGGYAVLG
jgi:hypothetical protein